MATAQSNVTVNISANTGDLDAKLAKQEAQIKTLDGAINVLGGSVELAASAMVGLGLANEESAEKFEATALAAIAFADGSKRVLDGVKSLNEGLKSYGGISGAAAKATKALNAAVLANPYVAVVGAVIALTAAIGAYLVLNDDTVESEKKRFEILEKLNRQQLDQITREEKLAALRGDSIEAQAELRKQAIQAQIDAKFLEKQQVRGENAVERTLELIEEIDKLEKDLDQVDKETAIKVQKRDEAAKKAASERLKKQTDERKKTREDELAAEKKFLDDTLKAQQDYTTKLNAEFEKRKSDRQALADYEHELLMEEFNAVLTDLEKRKTVGQEALSTEAALLNAQLQLTQAVGDSIANLGALFEQGTKAAKTAAIADIAINTAIGFVQALDIAQKSAAGTGPAAALAFPIFYASQIAAVLGAVASAKNVLAQTPGGSGGIVTTQPAGAIGSGTPRINRPDLGQYGQGGFLAPGAGGVPTLTPQMPVQAYVLASDVTTGLQAYGQINRRRRFG